MFLAAPSSAYFEYACGGSARQALYLRPSPAFRDEVGEKVRLVGGGLRLVVGLGNPGAKYHDTRHNLGYRVVDTLASRSGTALDREECASLVGLSDNVLLVKPLTYMNRSGFAVRCLLERRNVEPSSALVIYDEIHLPLGSLRLRGAGDPAGHRGMESIIQNVQTTEVPRMRLGVGGPEGPPPGEARADYVLRTFAPEEVATADSMVGRAADAAEAWLSVGLEQAMSQFNRTATDSS